MNRLAFVALTVIPVCFGAENTGKPYRYNGGGYTLFGFGACQHKVPYFNASVGGEALLVKGLSLGAEVGYNTFIESRSKSWGLGLLNVGYHFVDRSNPKKFEPFINWGVIGAGFGEGSFGPAASLGGGVIYWFKPKMGIRSEFRYMVISEERIPMFGVGISFR